MIRNSAKAVIIEGTKILLTKNRDEQGYFYLFPGGGQEHGETLENTVKRECLEEVGRRVEVKQLVHLREYIGKNHEYTDFDRHVHQIEMYFICQLQQEGLTQLVPTNPDAHQVGMEWLPIENLLDYRIYPKAIRSVIQDLAKGRPTEVYMGDVN